jgi:hypothetical protein
MAGVYRRHDAMQYAIKWAHGRNPDYRDYSGQGGGGDCANYVSQVLHAGGWPLDNRRGWWSYKHHSTPGWTVANELRLFLKNNHRAWECERTELTLGDVVFQDLEGRAVLTMVVTGVNREKDADIFVCGHTNDRLNASFNHLEKFNSGNGVTWQYWKLAEIIPVVRPDGPGHVGLY